MKSTRGPSIVQVLKYDISSQRFGILSFLGGIIGIVVLYFYGLATKPLAFTIFGVICLLFSLLGIARIIWRFRLFQATYENGETTMATLVSVSKSGDEITVSGHYEYHGESHRFSTVLQKTRRTKKLAVGNQVWLMVNQDNPKNVFIRDLYIPDSPEEIRQSTAKKKPIHIPEISEFGEEPHQIKIQWAGEYGERITTKKNPSESEITKMIQDVYASKAYLGILEINEGENIFMQIGYGGSPLAFCAGSDGPVYEVSATPIEDATKCFLSLHAGDDYWRTALPWKIQKRKVRAQPRKKVPS